MGVSDKRDIKNVQCWGGGQDQGWETLFYLEHSEPQTKHVTGASQTLHIYMSPLSDTPISGLGAATNELMSWIRCDW